MTEYRLFPEGTIPPEATREWYQTRERAPHLEQGPHRLRLYRARDYVLEAVRQVHASYPARGVSVVDLGAGDGGLLSLLRESDPKLTTWGYDLAPANVAGATERGVDVELLDFVNEPGWVHWAHVVVMTETLEHLVDPHRMLRRVFDNADALVCSSPWSETDTSHDGVHLWAWNEEGYRKMIEDAGWQVRRQERVDRLFQVVLAT